MRKNRKQKQEIYEEKYAHIPVDYHERLCWLYDHLNLTEKENEKIMEYRYRMIQEFYYNNLKIVLYEIPEGTPRPRARIIHRQQLINEAVYNSNYVHVYQIGGSEDNKFMQRLCQENLIGVQGLLCTPCSVTYSVFMPLPSNCSKAEIILSEIGLKRPLNKPDWDNIGKKYSDMSNLNIWLDDSFAVDGQVRKFYSVLPRIEIDLDYMNMVYDKKQYNAILKRTDYNNYDTANLDFFKY